MSPTTPSGTNSRCQTTYLCDASQCSIQYQTQEELQDHISSKHHDIQSPNHTKSNPDAEKVDLQAYQAIEATYHCNVPQCSIHFHTLEELHLHSASEHQDTRSSTHQKPGDSEDYSSSRYASSSFATNWH